MEYNLRIGEIHYSSQYDQAVLILSEERKVKVGERTVKKADVYLTRDKVAKAVVVEDFVLLTGAMADRYESASERHHHELEGRDRSIATLKQEVLALCKSYKLVQDELKRMLQDSLEELVINPNFSVRGDNMAVTLNFVQGGLDKVEQWLEKRSPLMRSEDTRNGPRLNENA